MKVWEEWQKRALVAERENERLRKALQEIADLGHDDESCAGFIAYKVLNTK